MLPSFSTIQKHVGVCVLAEEVGEGWSKSRGGHAAKTYCRIKASVYDTLSYTAEHTVGEPSQGEQTWALSETSPLLTVKAVSCESHCERFKLAHNVPAVRLL